MAFQTDTKPSHNRLLQAAGALTYKFEELSIEIEPGCFAGMFNGAALVTYWNDEDGLQWFVHDIEVECGNGSKVTLQDSSYGLKHITFSRHLYLAIWDVLTEGAFKDAIDGQVRAEIES
jgi:hypothetical protein